MSQNATTTDAVEILHRLFIKDDPERQASLFAEEIKSNIAQRVYDLRSEAGLTQKQLAKKVGTTAKVIDNLEMTDYEDHEMGDVVLMLQRIAKAFGKRIDVDFRVVPEET
jgi:ribosome-binding protein aMBF1 (putative translation factor)